MLALICRVGEGLIGGQMIAVALAWLGVLASIVLVVILPLQLAGLVGRPVGLTYWFMWLPMLVFEVALALWLLIKGVTMPGPRNGVAHGVARD